MEKPNEQSELCQMKQRIKQLEGALGKTLKEAIKTLREEIDRLKKDSSNSSKPPLSELSSPQRVSFTWVAGNVNAAAAFMKGSCHMSYTTIQQFFKELMKLDISRGMLCKATQKISDALKPAYDQLADRLPNESQVNVDETGHHNQGDLHWTWCFDTSDYSLFKIDPSRGSSVLEAMLGRDFAGMIGADYWGAYRKYARLFGVRVQYCMAHLIRDIRFLAEHRVRKLSRWGSDLLEWLKKLFSTLHRKEQLTEPNVEPTNNGTERQIRPAVIDRRITQGTRGDAGMRWCERIWTVLATCKKQNRNVFEFIHESVIAHWNKNKYPSLIC